MILLYANKITPRLQYTCSFVFKEQLGTECIVTRDQLQAEAFDGSVINYSNDTLNCFCFKLPPANLLFENDIQEQAIHCFEQNGFKAFYKIDYKSDFAFDILAASFYLLSRYEEYLPHTKDMYGRYAHENSLAFKEGFLDLPLINIWLHDFVKALGKKIEPFTFKQAAFSFTPTYDIDIAFSYRHKGFARNLGGFLKAPSLKRLSVLAGLSPDPFDSYDWMDALHKKYDLNPIYFFLLAKEPKGYDKNILPSTAALQKLVKNTASIYTIGIHPGWQSGDDDKLLLEEIKTLEIISHQPVHLSRQHYIRFNLPEGYRRLITAGITNEYSMGYGSINGFRASTGASFNWYDLQNEKETLLRIHPFCFMDANSFYEQKQSVEETAKELVHYLKVCQQYNTALITLWHNNFLGTDPIFKGWRELYSRFIDQVHEDY